ncbi:MAG TPA: flagellar basal body-associated FliL family protein [Polyangiaceae bacterium]|nr:flagellar basal body-associated FliL family protein [Polyangiaceae bacterium]
MSAEAEESAPEPKAPKKSRLGLVLATVVVVVLVTGAAVAGTLFGPALLGHKISKADTADQADQSDDEAGDDDAAPAKKKKKKEEKDGKIGESVELAPILVDARAKDGELHHLKVVLAIEIAEGTAKDEFMRYSPRGREAAVAYLRSQGFDDLASPEKYNEIRAELGKVFTEAVGEKRVGRVLVIDYVAQ